MKKITLKELESYPVGTVYCELDERGYAECFTIKGETAKEGGGFERQDLEPCVFSDVSGKEHLEWRGVFYRPPDWPQEKVIVLEAEDIQYLVAQLTGVYNPLRRDQS